MRKIKKKEIIQVKIEGVKRQKETETLFSNEKKLLKECSKIFQCNAL